MAIKIKGQVVIDDNQNIISSGEATATNFKTGTTNVHNSGIEVSGINVLGGDTPIGSEATIYDNGNASFVNVTATTYYGDGSNLTGLFSGAYADLTGKPTIPTHTSSLVNNSGYITNTNSTFPSRYYEFGDGHGSVSNDGNWHGRLNVAGSSHARIDATSVSDGIITSMYSHTGVGAGKVGTMSNHQLDFMIDSVSRASLSTAGSLSSQVQGILWGSANDGSGSGLDADLLDGLDSSTFVRLDQDNSVTKGDMMTFSNNIGDWGFRFQNTNGTNNYVYMAHPTYGMHVRNDSASTNHYILDAYPANGNRFQVRAGDGVVTSGGHVMWHAGNLSNVSQLTNNSGYQTEAQVDAKVSALETSLTAGAPGALDTLNELAAALGDDANFASSMTNSLAAKADSSSLATVATSGSYNDLSNKPSIPTHTSSLTNNSGFVSTGQSVSFADGTFSGPVQSGGNPWQGAAIGSKLFADGSIATNQTTASNKSISVFNGGTEPTAYIQANGQALFGTVTTNGSATFAGNLSANGSADFSEGKINLYSDGNAGYNLDTSNWDQGVKIFGVPGQYGSNISVYNDGSKTGAAFRVYDASDGYDKIHLYHDGNAGFNLDTSNWDQGVKIFGFSDYGSGISVYRDSGISAHTGAVFRCYDKPTNNNTVAFYANGGARFGAPNTSSSDGYGAVVDMAANAATVRAQCQQTASQYTELFAGYMGANKNFNVIADGSATFAGTVDAAGFTVNGSPMSSAVGGISFAYTYDSDLAGNSSNGPIPGRLKTSNTNLDSNTTQILPAYKDADTADITDFYQSLSGGYLKVSSASDSSQYSLFSISSVDDYSAWFGINVTRIGGTVTDFSDETDVILSFDASGGAGGSGGDAATLAGMAPATAATGDTIAQRHNNGSITMQYAYTQWVQARNSVNTAFDPAAFVVMQDGWYYHLDKAAMKSTLDVGFIPQNYVDTAYTLTADDKGKHIKSSGQNVTVPSGVFSTGDVITIYNYSFGSATLNQGSGVTMYHAGSNGSTGNRSLANFALATILCTGSDEFIVSGTGVS